MVTKGVVYTISGGAETKLSFKRGNSVSSAKINNLGSHCFGMTCLCSLVAVS